MKIITPWVIDFETEAIERRPVYPPTPVGVSIIPPGKKPTYYAWGHPTENNCDKDTAIKKLEEAYASNQPLLFHHAKFDCEVAEKHMGLAVPDYTRIHDTMYLLFLVDPHAPDLKLKPSAERILGMPPEEQEEVRDWLVANKIVKKGVKDWGKFIAKAPGNLVGKYANGDTFRTLKLFQKTYPMVVEQGMLEAYNRERELMPILLENEKEGILVDVRALEEDIDKYEQQLVKADKWLRRRLKAPGLNIDSDADLADALDAMGVVTDWNYTEKTGKRSTSKKNLTVDMFHDKKVASVLGYRGRLSTCMGTFMLPWYDMASANNGRINTNWNQVKNDTSKGQKGTRTGRLSCNPNFQNIPKDFYDKNDGYVHPKFAGLEELPYMRRYVLPDKKEMFCHRDYNQQELRILAHFEDADLKDAYVANPKMDIHTFVQDAISEIIGTKLERRKVKVLNFGIVYGMGLGKLAMDMQISVDEAKKVKAAQGKALPGLPALNRETKQRGKEGEPIRTWGGRLYYTEEPVMIDGRWQTFEYKLLNYLIQGSAADCTKQAIINYHKMKKEGRFLATVHDEINISAPKRAAKAEMEILREAMEGIAFDVPMLSDGKIGVNWLDVK